MKRLLLFGCVFLSSLKTLPQSWEDLHNQVSTLTDKNEFTVAFPVAIQAVEKAKNEFGEGHRNHITSLVSLGVLYFETGKYDSARFFYEQAMEAGKKTFGTEDSDYAKILNNLARVLLQKGDYSRAEVLYQQAGAIWEKIYGQESVLVTNYLIGLAVIYERTGQYAKAEKNYLETIRILSKIKSRDHPNYSLSLNNLAILYSRMGQYEKSEPLFTEASEIRKAWNKGLHSDYAETLHNLANLYTDMGQFEKAESLYNKAKLIRAHVFGERSYEFAQSLSDIAIMYAINQQFSKAEAHFLQTINLVGELLGENHPDYATNLNNLAQVYQSMQAYEKAAFYLAKAIEIRKKTIGEMHPYYASSMSTMMLLYTRTREYEKAAQAAAECLRIRKITLGENHPEYISTLFNLAEVYIRMDRFEQAEPLLVMATQNTLQNIRKVFSILSENEKVKYLANNQLMIDNDNSFIFNYRRASSSMLANNYNLQLGFKSLSLADTRNMLQAARNNLDTGVQKIFSKWLQQKNLLARQYSLPKSKQMTGIDSLESEAEDLEKKLSRLLTGFREQQSAFNLTVADIQKSLQQDEAAVEFVKFNYFRKGNTDSVLYAAYILKPNHPDPVFVPLFEERQLQRILDSAGKSATAKVSKLYRGVEIKGKTSAGSGKDLYQLIWSPLEPHLENLKRISYAPSGKLNEIALHALPADSNILLIDKYQMQQYTSTRQLALRKQESKTNHPGNIALFGDAHFSMDSTELVAVRKVNSYDSSASVPFTISSTRGSYSGSWPGLPGTAEEVKKINELFAREKISATVYTKSHASEENLKRQSGNSPYILHIATHGFFLPEPEVKSTATNSATQSNKKIADEPLLRSGLILSGGNHVWSGKAPIEGVEDGIITAYEISQLNLSNTELVVLSACETALGDIKGSEGVFGLQRAFKMAGVKKMIVSLWQVPDKETAELMTAFYSYWLKGKTIEAAFAQAQADMRKKYPPYYWAAFVLVE